MNGWGWRLTRSVGFALAGLASWASGLRLVADELELLDGTKLPHTVARVASDGTLSGPQVPVGLSLDDVRRWRRDAADKLPEPNAVVELHGDVRLAAAQVDIVDEQIRITIRAGVSWSLPLELARGVRFDVGVTPAAYAQALARPGADVDQFLVRGEEAGALERLEGLVENASAERVRFELAGKPRDLPRERVYGIVFARPANQSAPSARGWLGIASSGRVPFERLELRDESFVVAGPAGWQATIPRNLVTTVELRPPRLTFLSDLEPMRVEESTVVAPPGPWRRDRSVGGRRLTLGGATFEKGIGVRAASSLTFKLDGRHELFLATVGIDAETQGAGDCEMEVLADEGRSLWKQRVQGGQSPHAVRLDVRNVRSLTLRVLPGEDLDLSDHADWADARLVRGKP